jgi:hypothetical protein
MRDNRKKNNKLKFTLAVKEEEKKEEQPKNVVIEIHDSNLTSKAIYGGNNG